MAGDTLGTRGRFRVPFIPELAVGVVSADFKERLVIFLEVGVDGVNYYIGSLILIGQDCSVEFLLNEVSHENFSISEVLTFRFLI